MKQTRYHRFFRLGKEAFWVAMGQSVTVLGGVIGVRFLTNLLDPIVYGELALGMTMATLIHQVILGPLGQSFLRFFSLAEIGSSQLGGYLLAIRLLLIKTTLILIGVTLGIFFVLWLTGHTNWIWLVLAAFFFALFSGFNSSLDSVQNAARQRLTVAWHQGLGQWLRFLIAALFIKVLGAFSSVAMIGYALASVIVLSSQYIFFRRNILVRASIPAQFNQNDVKDWSKRIWQYAWPFMTWGIFTWAQVASDRWALQALCATTDVGLYAVLYQLGYYPLMLFSGFLSTIISPILFSHVGNGSNPKSLSRARRTNNLVIFCLIVLTMIGTFLVFILHRQIFSLLVAPQYRTISHLLPWMVMAGGLFAAGQVACLHLLTGFNSKALVIPKIATGILGIFLNILGAKWFGLKGVVFSQLMFSVIFFLWIIWIGTSDAAPKSNFIFKA